MHYTHIAHGNSQGRKVFLVWSRGIFWLKRCERLYAVSTCLLFLLPKVGSVAATGVACFMPIARSRGLILVCLGWRRVWVCLFCLRWNRILMPLRSFLSQKACLLIQDTRTWGFANFVNKWMVMMSLVYVVILWAPFFWRSGVAVAPSWLSGIRCGVAWCLKPASEDGVSSSERPVAERPRGQRQRDRRLQRRIVLEERIEGQIAEQVVNIPCFGS